VPRCGSEFSSFSEDFVSHVEIANYFLWNAEILDSRRLDLSISVIQFDADRTLALHRFALMKQISQSKAFLPGILEANSRLPGDV
jgi:hypothetical protein